MSEWTHEIKGDKWGDGPIATVKDGRRFVCAALVPDAEQIVSDHVRVEALEREVAAKAAEIERLRETVKGAWRYWADARDSVVRPTLDRGYVLLRIRGDVYDEFDALFRVSAALEAAAPRAGDGGAEGVGG